MPRPAPVSALKAPMTPPRPPASRGDRLAGAGHAHRSAPGPCRPAPSFDRNFRMITTAFRATAAIDPGIGGDLRDQFVHVLSSVLGSRRM